ncbi:VIT family protein [Corynebacterium atrinae]|uniref:VIT1/CCC1 transporter family protein n=1 Tax=Corynebacterium atrinae TaxID=1336740 RepID=UPI0025B3F0AA|nr:VIT family protein [Corynebacterium atrinae]WJY63873.1 VIT family protein [Corynebacterium atrinae]
MAISQVLLGHRGEAHNTGHNSRLNWLRAGVLGANDGIVSVAALLLGIIATGADEGPILTAGIAATVAGAVSMSLGEYVSVSAQKDSERMLMDKEKRELAELPEAEEEELVGILQTYGIERTTAEKAAAEIGAGDPLPVHLKLELGMTEGELTSPLAAAGSSAAAFLLGAILPMLAVLVAPHDYMAWIVTIITLVALAITGVVSAYLAGTSKLRSMLRLLIGGSAGLALTYFAGALFGGMA